MNILFLSHRIPFPPNKGEKIRTFHQIKYLAEQGHTLYVACPYESPKELEYFTQLKSQYCIDVIGVVLPNKLLRMGKGILGGNALSVANFYHKDLQTRIDNLIVEHGFDAILCTASSMAEYIFQSKTLYSVQQLPTLLMDFMDLDSDKWLQYGRQASFPMKLIYQREAKLVARFEKRVAETFDACFFITATECEMFKANCPDMTNIYAIENGMDTSAFHPSPKGISYDNPILLFTGVMDYAPNVDAVIWFTENVWPQILARWPQAEFFIAGMNPSSEIVALQKVQGITVTGFVDDILPYFHRANIFVAPFRIARGVQNKILQAFACGLPVITTPMGAEGIRCSKDHDILIADTSAQYLDHINQLLSSSSLYNDISKNALSTIKQCYEWDALLKPMMKIIEKYKLQAKRVNNV